MSQLFNHTAATLDALVDHSRHLQQIRKTDVKPGDMIYIKTCNSIYSIRLLDDGNCRVAGGWFDRKGLSPMNTRIAGCTWGGSAIKLDVVAACGLCLEFSNRLVTTSVQRIFVLPAGSEN